MPADPPSPETLPRHHNREQSPRTGRPISLRHVCLAILIALTVFHLFTTDRMERPGRDSSVYILGGRSLASNGSYSIDGVRITTHPPGLPVLLAIVIRFSGSDSYEYLLRFLPLAGCAALLVWLLILEQATGAGLAAAAVLLVSTSPVYYEYATRQIMAELPYLLFSGLALLALFRLHAAQSALRVWMWGSAAALFAGYAVLTRTAGVALAPAMLAIALWPRRLPGACAIPLRLRLGCAAAALAGLLVAAGWTAWGRPMEGREEMGGHMASYGSVFFFKDPLRPDAGRATVADLLLRAVRAAPLRAAQTAEIFTGLPWISPRWYSPLVVALLILPLVAAAGAAREPLLLLLWLYFAAFFAVLCLWPFAENARFMLPVAPLHFLFAWLGGRSLVAAVRAARPSLLTAVLVALTLAAAISAGTGRTPPGLQDRLSLAFWPAAAVASIAFHALKRAMPGLSLPPARMKPAMHAVFLLLVGMGIARQAMAARENLHPRPETHANGYIREVVAWLRQAPPGAVMARMYSYVHRMTGRRCVAFPVTEDVNRIRDAIARQSVRYLVASSRTGDLAYFHPSEPERIAALKRAFPSLLRLAHQGKDWSVYEITAPLSAPARPKNTPSTR